MLVDGGAVQLLYPEVDPSFKTYHEDTILALPISPHADPSHDRADPSHEILPEMIAPDDPLQSLKMASENHPSAKLFDAVCPIADNSIPVFMYGSLARPDMVASVIADKSSYRTYEQAARMMPASLLDHEMTICSDGSEVVGVEAAKGMHTNGMLLFSTTGRERVLISRFKGEMFKDKMAKAEVLVEGKTLRMNVMVWAWADEEDNGSDAIKDKTVMDGAKEYPTKDLGNQLGKGVGCTVMAKEDSVIDFDELYGKGIGCVIL